jgi:hypothetical protein
MKHVEKLDLVLRELYKHRFDGILYSITDILAEIGGNPNLQEAKMIGKRLEEDGHIVYVESSDSADARIDSRGIQYCEASSYIDESIAISQFNFDYLFAKPGSQITKDHVRGLVAQSKMDEAIKALSNFPKPQTIQDVLDTQLGRLTRINTDFYYGFITHEEKETQMVRISAALIEIINSL